MLPHLLDALTVLLGGFLFKIIMSENYRFGEKRKSANSGYYVLLEYITYKNCTVQFEDGTIIKNINYHNVKNGKIKNLNHPRVYGKGWIGYGEHTLCENPILGQLWHTTMKKAYNENYKLTKPSYKDCTVVAEWHNFQVFAKWYYKNYNPEIMQKWHLDKDILVKGNKHYSPETCCFVPCEINGLFIKSEKTRGKYPIGIARANKKGGYQVNANGKYIGTFPTIEEAFQAYKTAKEVRIKEVAEKWKHLIEPKVYQALINYQVEITD